MEIRKICDEPQLLEIAASWFSEKWGVPEESYRESIGAYIGNPAGIPKWFVILDENEKIIAGVGIIENDFHQRKDLTPNLCALFVEPAYRKQDLARKLMDFAKKETAEAGFDKLYLITDHTEFYEKCGWTFYGTIKEDDGADIRMYETKTGF